MKILHICSYYNTSKVYSELVNALHKKNISQTVFIPIKRREDIIYENVVYSHCLRPILKISLFLKALCVVIALLNKYGIKGLKKFDVIHCHTLFADGLPGYLIHLLTGVEYIATIRNSDYNAYLKYFYHLRYIGKIISKNAKKTIFVSIAYKEKFLSKYPNLIRDNYLVIPNGVNNYWLSNQKKFTRINKNSTINILSIGYFDKNKNFGNALAATNQLLISGYKIKHHFIGGSAEEFIKIYGITPKNNCYFYGKIKNKHEIDAILSVSDILVVPSYVETFGLVYIEALSRGVRVICSQYQGIFGNFNNNNLMSFCNPDSINSIAMSITDLIQSGQQPEKEIDISIFNWSHLSNRYLTEAYN